MQKAGAQIFQACNKQVIAVYGQDSENLLEARVGIEPFSPQLRDKNAHFPEVINLNLLNQTIPILTGLVSVLVSASSVELARVGLPSDCSVFFSYGGEKE